jgi:signal-transduction protein with cAMP-binding, CBS, and nucleotidyltransferase domain
LNDEKFLYTYVNNLMPLLVRELMSRKVNKIDEKKTVYHAAKQMAKERRGYVVVVRKNKPVGILTDSDILEKVISKGRDPKKVKVSEVMSSPIITISPNDEIVEASRLMRKNSIKRIPVVEKGKLIGIITDNDIARVSPEFINIIEERLRWKEEGIEPGRIEGRISGVCEECDNYSDNLYNFNGRWLCEDCKDLLEKD